jgi:hypothetical protein
MSTVLICYCPFQIIELRHVFKGFVSWPFIEFRQEGSVTIMNIADVFSAIATYFASMMSNFCSVVNMVMVEGCACSDLFILWSEFITLVMLCMIQQHVFVGSPS